MPVAGITFSTSCCQTGHQWLTYQNRNHHWHRNRTGHYLFSSVSPLDTNKRRSCWKSSSGLRRLASLGFAPSIILIPLVHVARAKYSNYSSLLRWGKNNISNAFKGDLLIFLSSTLMSISYSTNNPSLAQVQHQHADSKSLHGCS